MNRPPGAIDPPNMRRIECAKLNACRHRSWFTIAMNNRSNASQAAASTPSAVRRQYSVRARRCRGRTAEAFLVDADRGMGVHGLEAR